MKIEHILRMCSSITVVYRAHFLKKRAKIGEQ